MYPLFRGRVEEGDEGRWNLEPFVRPGVETNSLTSNNFVYPILVPEPVVFYPLNKQFGTADVMRRSQITGRSNNVSLTTGPFSTTDGAYEFWGDENSYIEFPNGDNLLDVHNSISLMCWVRPEGNDGPLFQYNRYPLKWGVHIWINKGKFFNRIIEANYNNWKTPIVSKRRLERGKWVHVAATYNHITGNNSIYVNGILNATQNIGTGFRIAAGGKVRMGSVRVDKQKRFLRAAVSHMEVYNFSLNVNQIRAVMNKGNSTINLIAFRLERRNSITKQLSVSTF